MALIDELFPASYKDVPFLVNVAAHTGGRKHAKHEFPNSNIQNIEDLGLKPREYRITAIIAEPNYSSKRNALLAALESGDSGILIHPFYGRIENISALDYSLIEDAKKLGDLEISILFAPNTSTGIPVQAENTLSIISQSSLTVFGNILNDVAALFIVTNAFTGNYRDAQTKLNSFVTAVESNVKTLTSTTGEANEFNQIVRNFETNINANINDPEVLSQGINDIFTPLPDLYDTPESQFAVQSLFFTFGDDDQPIFQTTAGRIERETNREVINSAVKSYALSQAYFSAASIDFQTVNEIEAVEQTLETAFQSIKDASSLTSQPEISSTSDSNTSGLSAITLDSIEDQRTVTQQFFDEQKLSAQQIITVNTQKLPARFISYQYYGDSSLGERIANLNDDINVSYLDRDIEIFTS